MLKYFLLIIFCLSSCGFQAMYKDDNKLGDNSYIEDLAAIRIQKNRSKLDQDLKNNLYDVLNPDYIKIEPKYFLILKIQKLVYPTFITETGASGRNKILLNVSYELKNLENAETIASGSTSVNDNYDVSTNRYGTFVVDEYIQTNLTKIAAQNIRNLLVNDFLVMKEKEEEKKENKK